MDGWTAILYTCTFMHNNTVIPASSAVKKVFNKMQPLHASIHSTERKKEKKSLDVRGGSVALL